MPMLFNGVQAAGESHAGLDLGGSLAARFPPVRLAVVTTHPIQYHSEWFRALANEPSLDLDVLYCHRATPEEQAGAGFGVKFDWDIPLLQGYKYRFLRNVSSKPVGSFSGIDTPELASLIADNAYEAVLVNGWHYKSAWQAIRACWNQRVPVMVRSDSHLRTKRNPVKKLLKEIPYRWFISRLDACLAAGEWSRDYFIHYGARADRVFLVPHAVKSLPDEELRALDGERLANRERWGLRRDGIVFVFSGKFTEVKRPMDFVQAVTFAAGRFPEIEGLMVGDGALRGQCESVSEKSGAPIHFTGFLNQSEIAKAYIAADALVLASSGETWGIVVNEAMNFAKPCIVGSHSGCAPDLVLEGETGFTFPPGDVNGLASLMVRMAAHPEALPVMGRNARRRVCLYSIQAAVQGVLSALSEAVVRL